MMYLYDVFLILFIFMYFHNSFLLKKKYFFFIAAFEFYLYWRIVIMLAKLHS